MTARANLTYLPRLLGEAEAARYIGVSANTLRALSIPRRVLGARRLYLRDDLDAYAYALPSEGQPNIEAEEDACDRAFGIRN
ncbi:DNA-binding protein [Paracoccus suum]|uniref:DNA-binding protein n=1 Tax=Paracoccus suum TaxID=2259340 RepID=A0A344PKW8_9RHOB|nr:helix-turn-helix domain-containing protein [Paracoccus suum]AXC50023.1 DNA-binding protein [Paracoccus suum]